MEMMGAPMTISSAATSADLLFGTTQDFIRTAQTGGVNLTLTITGSRTTTLHVYAEEVTQHMDGTTEIVWRAWNDHTTCGTATIDTCGTVTSTINARVWNAWDTSFTTDNVRRPTSVGAPYGFAKMSRKERDKWEAAQLAAEERRVQQQREYERRVEEERVKRVAAEKKAYDLMMTYLTPEQRDEYERLQRFHVISSNGKTYRIKKGSHGNIELLEEIDGKKRPVESLCVQPKGQLPCYDSMLAQKLHLETDEDEVRRVANIHNLRDYRRAV